ncbi:hypothetical protein ACFL6D_02490 [Spirochaetota bacterium]
MRSFKISLFALVLAIVNLIQLSNARNIIFFPALDNAESGATELYNKYFQEEYKGGKLMPNKKDTLIVRDFKSEKAMLNPKNLEGANAALVADVLSVNRFLGIFRKAVVAFRYVDVASGEVLWSKLRKGYGFKLFNSDIANQKAVRHAGKKFVRKKHKIKEDHKYNDRKPAFVMIPSSGISKDIRSRALEGYLMNIIAKDKRYNLIERRILEFQLQEQGLSLSGMISEGGEKLKTGELAKITYGVRYEVVNILIAKVMRKSLFNKNISKERYYCYITVNFQVLDFKTGMTEVIVNKVYSTWFSKSSEFSAFAIAAIKSMADAKDLCTKYINYYYPLPSKDKKQKVELGKEEGLKKGKGYSLYRTLDIKDPFTGKSLGNDYKKIGKIKIKDIKEHSSTIKLKSKKLKDDADSFVFKQNK